MLFGRPKTASETKGSLLSRLGLTSRDVSAEAAAALEKLAAERDALAERLEAAEALADRDTLTPALNRRAFIRELHRTMSEVERYRSGAAVLYLDLDGFKALNDAYGHAAGDAVLKLVARRLSDNVRESDVIGRLGGDEFGVILNRVGADEAYAKADALTHALNDVSIAYAGIEHRVSASVGVHVIRAVEEPETALARADEAMYADKHARRSDPRLFSAF